MNPFKYMMMVDYVKSISGDIQSAVSLLEASSNLADGRIVQAMELLKNAIESCDSFDEIF